ncbi:MAG TPA: hypothetical protein VG844_04585 [Terracidiphilus sp.]|nr:hypothetical protein [Terracidiphilus sp.]
MRNYYFWYVICAAVAKMAHLPVRAVLIGSCVWSGFALATLIGLYLKHFLLVGSQLRRQFVLCVSLLAVTGLDVFGNLWNILILHRPMAIDFEQWSMDPIISWFDTLLLSPHHVAGLVLCMFAFLLTWKAEENSRQQQTISVILAAMALASAFGTSIYVTFAFFLVMLAWGFWQIVIERTPRRALLLIASGTGAFILLIPYLWQLAHTSSGMQGGTPFAFAIREMIPSESLLSSSLLQHLAVSHPIASRNIAKLILLVPSYVLELGFFFLAFLCYLIPAYTGRKPLAHAHKSLLFIAVAIIPLISLMRSSVLRFDDFGFRAPLLLQFSLLLLSSELLIAWGKTKSKTNVAPDLAEPRYNTPEWLRSASSLALFFGVVSTVLQLLVLRTFIPLTEAQVRGRNNQDTGEVSHNAYLSYIGYAQMDAAIPMDAIVQFNPAQPNPFAGITNTLNVNRQVVISTDELWCGSELGGDPSGCPAMNAAIDPIFKSASAEQARAMCHLYGIQYLVAKVYDPAWNNMNGWVWTLPAVVSDKEFRVLDCRE